MIFVFVLHVIFVPMSDCVLIPVRRDINYDTIVWNGDCSRLKATFTAFSEEKTCVCLKKLEVNGIESELRGTLYQTTGAFPICLYGYRETGNVRFLSTTLIWKPFPELFASLNCAQNERWSQYFNSCWGHDLNIPNWTSVEYTLDVYVKS